MEIATPARSSPFPKLTFDHKLIIAKHLVSTNGGDDKRKTPNHLNGEDESSTCDLSDDYESGAKSRLNYSNITDGIVISSNRIDKPTTTTVEVGDKPIIISTVKEQQHQRQEDMPTKMSENHHHLNHVQPNYNNSVATLPLINNEDLCNNNNIINRDIKYTTGSSTITTITPNHNNHLNNIDTHTIVNQNNKLYDAQNSLDNRITKTTTSVTTVHGNDELLLKSSIYQQQQTNCNSKSDLKTNSNHVFTENCNSTTNGTSNEKHVSSAIIFNGSNAFKVPADLSVNINSSGSNNSRSSPSSPTAPYRKQSVFVAPAGLNWIIHKNRNNSHQQQSIPINLIDSSRVSSPPSQPLTTSSQSSISSLPFNSSLSSSSTSTTSTVLPTTIGVNGEASTLDTSSSSTVNCRNNNSNSNPNYSANNNGNITTFTRKNSTKANAQEIEQHISKIISENAAIVETLDPLWSKRYLSRHSVSSIPTGSLSTSSSFTSSSSSFPATSTGSTTINTSSLPSRRYSEIVVDPNHASSSKLQSALLGRVLTTCSSTTGTTVVTPSNVPHLSHAQHHRLTVHPNGPTKKFSEPIYPSVIINMKQQQQVNLKTGEHTEINDQTGLRPSLVRNLLTSSKSPSAIKVIPLPTTTSLSTISTIVDNSTNVNPDNPEGSIIKDLLLKARDSSESSNERQQNSRANNNNPCPSIPPIQEELSMLVYVCTLCTICFRNKENLEAHQLHYCKANETQASINERSPNQLQLLNDHVQRKISVMESNFLQQQLTKPVQSSASSASNSKSCSIFTRPQLVNQQNHHHQPHLKQQQPQHYQSSAAYQQATQQQPLMGNILKQQLLAPSIGPPIKKRKTSEPIFPKSHRFSHPNYPLLNQHPSQLHHADTNNSHGGIVRKTSVVQGPNKLLIHKNRSSSTTNKETTIESAAGLSSNLSSSSSLSTMINDNHVISVTNEPITFSPSNTIAMQSTVFSSSNHSYSFFNQSSLDRLSSSASASPLFSTNSTCNQKQQPEKSSLDILPDYYPHLKCPKTKVTLTGPIVFPVLRKILTENKENIEFQAFSESHQSPFTTSVSSLSPPTSSFVSTINPSGHNDSINSHLVYKQISSIPEFEEDLTVGEKVEKDINQMKCPLFKVKSEDGQMIKCDQNLTIEPDKLDHQNQNHHQQITLVIKGEDLDSKFADNLNVDNNFNSGHGVDNHDDNNYDVDRTQLIHDNYETSSGSNCDYKLNNITNGLINNRPTTLILSKNHSTLSSSAPPVQSNELKRVDNKLIGSTLVSPDTPRPKRKCMQLYIKGQTYTYLGLKMSTRSTYCCIYRPQPMYVPQEASSKLSMYSNWKINPPHHDIFKLMSPAELLSAYDTRQWCFKANGISITFAPSLESKKSLTDSFISTPSSYWTLKKQPKEKMALKRELIVELKRKGVEDLTDTQMDANNNININSHSIHRGGASSSDSRKTSEDRLSTMSGFDSDSNDPNQPKRVKIFEGGFKSNEDYTYVRGRGRGKYVCEECGIRCKKPSMLKKHIRTHTDLRPYSCRHCAFAFKTKGNLTKHMKSKAHHKKCVELGIVPVPIMIDESQIDCEALAKQEALERSYSGGNLVSDDEHDPDDEEEEDDGSDDEGVPIPLITSSGLLPDQDQMEDEKSENNPPVIVNEVDEQEVARSLLDLSESGDLSAKSRTNVVSVVNLEDCNNNETQDTFQRRYSMSMIQDKVESLYFSNNNHEGPIDLSRRFNDDPESPVAGPSRYEPQPRRRATFSTPSSHPMCHATASANAGSSAASPFGMGTRDDGKAVCLTCGKSFTKFSQLRLHINVHFIERPFRCDSCSVSFRTKGHLQKHEKSVTHSDKVKINMAFGAPTTDNPRPFKCDDCIIAFRIHGHLAKHLRSKNHIMKLECIGKLPCGLYADLERFGFNLNSIETADCKSSLISLQRIAEKMYYENGEINTTWLSHLVPVTNRSNNPTDTAVVPNSTAMTSSTTSIFNDNNNNHYACPDNNGYLMLQSNESSSFSSPTLSTSPPSPPLPPPPSVQPQQLLPPITTTSTITPVTTSSTTNITSIRSNTCNYCKQVFKSAKFLQVHLYTYHQQQAS